MPMATMPDHPNTRRTGHHMKVAYVTIADPANIHAWSGTNHGILRALSMQEGVEVIPVGPLRTKCEWLSKAKSLAYRARPGGPRYLWRRDLALLRGYAQHAAELLRGVEHDLVLSPGTEAIAFLDTEKPVVFWSDAPFAAVVNYYPWYSHLSAATLREGSEADTRALERSDLAIYSSQWACDSAIRDHGAKADKVRVIPFGANLSSDVTDQTLPELIQSRMQAPWRFLLVAVEWERKGADIVLQVVGELNRRGCPAEMIVAGCRPPETGQPLPPYLKLAGYFDKKTDAGRRGLQELYRNATFYFMPSRAEATAIVYCEASSFGVPCLASDTGGTRSLVEDGVNGHCFPLDASIEEYADHIVSTITGGGYPNLARNALHLAQNRLNWPSSGKALHAALAEVLASRSGMTASSAPKPSNCLRKMEAAAA